jgi:hypothetical protein
MGMPQFSSRSETPNKHKKSSTPQSPIPQSSIPQSSNPHPRHYRVFKSAEVGEYVVVWVIYANCTNYEGKKILVFRNYPTFWEDIVMNGMDPHFFRERYSPIARFVPTDYGWSMAMHLVEIL